MSFPPGFRQRIFALKREIVALTFAVRHPGTPLAAKVLAFLVVAYALSPLDLIPDFIPVLGLLDDLVLLPLGILLVRRMIPGSVLDECRDRATSGRSPGGTFGRFGVVLVVAVWSLTVAGFVWACLGMASR